MPKRMTDKQVETAKKTAKEVGTFEFRDKKDPDDFIMATLFKDAKGHFRCVDESGMNSVLDGASFCERLTPTEKKSWKRFK